MLALGAGVLLGAPWGASLAQRSSPKLIRTVFAIFLAVIIIRKLYWLLEL
jgi:uncharacterized membrane protein YfcA